VECVFGSITASSYVIPDSCFGAYRHISTRDKNSLIEGLMIWFLLAPGSNLPANDGLNLVSFARS